MNTKSFFQFICIFLISCSSLTAQELTEKQKEYQENKVQIFTVEERNNLQNWIQEEFSQMNLSEEKEAQYNTILLSYMGKIQRLDDKDMGNSKEDIIQKMDEMIVNQDKELEKILSPEEFAMHVKIYDQLLLSVKNRIAETDYPKE
ncbi:hypothetical protein QWY87_09775 [Lutimonas halocynthiae]|uniref:hypothetical protein n=1 Tax=Lutimonas halocynthiae TaxID=1446477 RepID=UPI0025B3546A|nr:hypothetical protein [Lutimonas halocynthiae]MDN3642989.1 hypothetical protein [Lutimonas halocynthiae]